MGNDHQLTCETCYKKSHKPTETDDWDEELFVESYFYLPYTTPIDMKELKEWLEKHEPHGNIWHTDDYGEPYWDDEDE